MKAEVKKLIRNCDIFQSVKTNQTKPSGLLQPLPIPSQPWTHIFMDFIKGLPLSQWFNSLWVVVDRLIKYGHFISLTHHFFAKIVAQLFTKHVLKLHGMPNDIVSNKDNTFTSRLL